MVQTFQMPALAFNGLRVYHPPVAKVGLGAQKLEEKIPLNQSFGDMVFLIHARRRRNRIHPEGRVQAGAFLKSIRVRGDRQVIAVTLPEGVM